MIFPSFRTLSANVPAASAAGRPAQFVPCGTNLTQIGRAVDDAPHQFAGSPACRVGRGSLAGNRGSMSLADVHDAAMVVASLGGYN
jgi:hypothetical protein